MFGTDFRKLIEKTFWSCLKHFGLGPWSVEVAGVTCPRRSAAQIHLGKKEEEEETRPLEPWYFKWYLLYSLWSQTMPRDYGLWFQNLRQWLIQVVPCSTVGGNPQRETPFLYLLSWVGWWPSKLELLRYNSHSQNCSGALLSSCPTNVGMHDLVS